MYGNYSTNKNKRIMIPQQMNQIQKPQNLNSFKKPVNLNNFKINSSSNHIDELGKAFMIIRKELKKKDDRILELEKKISGLKNQLTRLNSGQNNEFNRNSKGISIKMASNDNGFNEEDNNTGINKKGYQRNYRLNLGVDNFRSNSYMKIFGENNPNYNSDTENFPKRYHNYDNLSNSNDNSLLTYNGIQPSKEEVKNYLKEVKSKIEPIKFKQFIKIIKLFTSKNNSPLNKNIIIESVRQLFGTKHQDLYLRFQNIVGAGKL
jgi:transposase-like protein